MMMFIHAQKIPEVLKTEFSTEALSQTITNIEDQQVNIASVLEKHKGKIVIIEFWAGWCRDCLIGMPASHKLQESNPDVEFVYLSLDRTKDSWKRGITKLNLQKGDNYWFHTGWKNDFTAYVDLNWIPRYIVVDQKGDIAKYYAVSADDPEIQETINSLRSGR